MALQHLDLIDAPIGANDGLQDDDGGDAGLAGDVRVLGLDVLDLAGRLHVAPDAHGALRRRRRRRRLFLHYAAFDAADRSSDHAALNTADLAADDATLDAADDTALFAAGHAFRHAADHAADLPDVDGL